MKRFLALFIMSALLLTTVLSGCGSGQSDVDVQSTESSTVEEITSAIIESSTALSETEKAPEEGDATVPATDAPESSGEITEPEETPADSEPAEETTPEETPDHDEEPLDTDPASTPEESEAPEASDTEEATEPTPTLPEEEPEEKPINYFEIYQSNSITPSGNNYALKSSDGNKVTETFRGLFKIQEFGELEYKFYFSNHVDSTYSNGSYSYRNMPTATYNIVSAKVGVVTLIRGQGTIMDEQELTFDGGQKTKTVAPEECYWSDAITIYVEEDLYLAFEWTVEYTLIPATLSENTIYLFDYSTGSIKEAKAAPMPDLIGCKRDNDIRIGFIGDSITMGVGAGNKTHKFWAAQITEALGTDVSAWNLGLGYARANDMVNSPAWLEKAKQNDIVVICFGVNDINSGGYGISKARTSYQIAEDIATIAKACTDAGAEVIIFTTPPYAYAGGKIPTWSKLVNNLKKLANDNGYTLFDFAAVLGDPDDPSKYIYGDHPNQAGCTAVANAFMESGIMDAFLNKEEE